MTNRKTSKENRITYKARKGGSTTLPKPSAKKKVAKKVKEKGNE